MVSDIQEANRALAAKVLGRPGVAGTAVGGSALRPCLRVYVDHPDAGRTIPKEFRGFPVEVEVTGTFRRL